MVKDHAGFRIDPALREQIDKLVAEGKYASFSEFMNAAIRKELYFDEFIHQIKTQIAEILSSPEGESIILSIIEKTKNKK